jgi:DNA ligase D-like protein (predicted 3'-phosphoesterase)
VPPTKRDPLRFVLNLHRATTLHFDLRLEVDGVLASWAVPKGPSLDPSAKRLAVQVDDHGLEHLDYEDDHKVVWDTGVYAPAEDPAPAIARGHLRFVVLGEKVRGGFALTRTRMGGHERNWILVKIDDEHADASASLDDDRSVLTGRTLAG